MERRGARQPSGPIMSSGVFSALIVKLNVGMRLTFLIEQGGRLGVGEMAFVGASIYTVGINMAERLYVQYLS